MFTSHAIRICQIRKKVARTCCINRHPHTKVTTLQKHILIMATNNASGETGMGCGSGSGSGYGFGSSVESVVSSTVTNVESVAESVVNTVTTSDSTATTGQATGSSSISGYGSGSTESNTTSKTTEVSIGVCWHCLLCLDKLCICNNCVALGLSLV